MPVRYGAKRTRVLWATTHDVGNWYPIAPVISELVSSGHDVVASGLPRAAKAAAALNVPFIAEAPSGVLDGEGGRPTGFDGLLDRRIRMAALTSDTLRPLLSAGSVDVVLADPFRYGAGLAARAEGVPWVSYLHHCDLGDPVVDGLFQMTWDEGGGGDDEIAAYRTWWSALRAYLGLDAEDRPAADIWRYAISDRLTLVLGPPRLVDGHLPDGGVAIGATPWEPPLAIPSQVIAGLDRRPVLLAAPPTRHGDFPLVQIAEAAIQANATLVVSGQDPTTLPVLPGRVIICPPLPHSKVMPLVDAVICGGGWGTTTKALAAGIPVVVIAHGFDTDNTARVVEAWGCGVRVGDSTTASIAAALRQVIDDPTIAITASKLSEPNAPMQAARRAVALIESAVVRR